MSKCIALIPAAGSGSRIGSELPKQYLSLAGKPMIWHAVATLARHERIARVYVVLAPNDVWFERHDWSGVSGKLRVLRCGGDTRAASVLNGLRGMQGEVGAEDWVLVHDAARPCLSQAHLNGLIASLENDPVGGILAVPVADTLKRADADTRIVATEPRENLWQAQTPQMFRNALLVRALEELGTETPTDEARAIEHLGLKPRLVACDSTNLKVTYPRDIRLAELILQHPEVRE
jgi:2-C-methyl-D-erythritol 4-phosphate cytidylyltransferase